MESLKVNGLKSEEGYKVYPGNFDFEKVELQGVKNEEGYWLLKSEDEEKIKELLSELSSYGIVSYSDKPKGDFLNTRP